MTVMLTREVSHSIDSSRQGNRLSYDIPFSDAYIVILTKMPVKNKHILNIF